jgi:tRNA threonylcarbamoyladenosine biosynthesis protein TsaE
VGNENISQNGSVSLPVSLPVATSAGMRDLGRALATLLRAGDLVILSGGLGAGKTTLTQGIGAGLGVRGPVTSPTFVIARVHPPLGDGQGGWGSHSPALVHVDAYRLGSALELDDLDLDTDTASSVTVVEWGEGLAEGLAADRLEIAITPAPHDAGGTAHQAATAGAGGDAGHDLDESPAETPRTVRVSAVGERWEGIKLPLADRADRL